MKTLGLVAAAHTSAPPSVTPGKPFFDDFLGSSIDSAKWTVFDRLSDDFNGEVNCCTPSNLAVSASMLQITGRHEDHVCGDTWIPPATMHYTSGHVGQATQPFLYGTVEVRARIAGGTGLWPCIWMLGYLWQPSQPWNANTEAQNWPVGGWCEMDIAEFMQGERNQVNCALHWNVANASGSGPKPIPYNSTSRFMVYRVQWSAGSLIWSVDAEDGVGWRTLHTISGAGNVPDVPMFVVLNMAIGGFGGGFVDPATFPQTMSIDYVRIT